MQLSSRACRASTHVPSWAGRSGGPSWVGSGDNPSWVGSEDNPSLAGSENNTSWMGSWDNPSWAGSGDNPSSVGSSASWAGKGHQQLRPWRRRGAGLPEAASQDHASPLSDSLQRSRLVLGARLLLSQCVRFVEQGLGRV
jgi:hypothetical protein